MLKDVYRKGYQYTDDCFFKLPQNKFTGKLFEMKPQIEQILQGHKEIYEKDLKAQTYKIMKTYTDKFI